MCMMCVCVFVCVCVCVCALGDLCVLIHFNDISLCLSQNMYCHTLPAKFPFPSDLLTYLKNELYLDDFILSTVIQLA